MGKPVESDSYLLDQYPGHVPLLFLQTFLSPSGTKAIRKVHDIFDAINNNAKVKPMLHRRLLALSVTCRVPWFKSNRRRMEWLRIEVYNNERRLLDFLGALPIKAFFDLREADAHVYDTAAENEEHLCLQFSEQLQIGPFTSLKVFEGLLYRDLAEAIVEGFGIPTSDPRGDELRSSVARGLMVAGRITTHVVTVQQSLPSICIIPTDRYWGPPLLNEEVAEKSITGLSSQIVNLNDIDETDLRALLHCLTEGTKPLLRVHSADQEQQWLSADMLGLWVLTRGLQPLIDVFEAGRPLKIDRRDNPNDRWTMLLYTRWPERHSFCSDFEEWWTHRAVEGLPDEVQSSGSPQFSNDHDVDALNVVHW